ncbi:hypothetical protein RCG24_19485 [Neobacillus sp. OS1-32]|nr:hypothetical protein [Neobacillus sp. OS1-32]WML30054.1 hypothetical protein RCG24_19485 [Neobacillus sp. OS1-32]
MADKEKNKSSIVVAAGVFVLIIIIAVKFLLGNSIVYYLRSLFS